MLLKQKQSDTRISQNNFKRGRFIFSVRNSIVDPARSCVPIACISARLFVFLPIFVLVISRKQAFHEKNALSYPEAFYGFFQANATNE